MAKIEKFNNILKANAAWMYSLLIFLIGVITWSLTQSNFRGEKILLLYMLANILTLSILGILTLRKNLTLSANKTSKENLILNISNHLNSSELIPFIFFIPILFSFVGIFAIDFANDRDPEEWIYIFYFILWLYFLYRWKKTRDSLLLEYREATKGPYLSIF